MVQFHIDKMMAITFIRRLGETPSLNPMQREPSLVTTSQQRNITILPPQRLASEDNAGADFLSRHKLQRCNFKLISSEFRRICRKLQVWPTLDAFASKWTCQIPRYITWNQDP